MSWIDSFDANWLIWLEERHTACKPASLLLLLDSAFVPGLYPRMQAVVALGDDCSAVFAHIGGYSERARDVTPFVVAFDPADRALLTLLRACDGHPMVSCIETDDCAAQRAERLSRWSVVDIGPSAFNFRHADTRRLPAISRTLRPAQRRSLLGPATAWHCVDRTGQWQALPLDADMPGLSEEPGLLDDAQFTALVRDSEADEMLSVLDARSGGAPMAIRPSRRHFVAETTLRRADLDGVQAITGRLQRVEDALRKQELETSS